MKLEGDYLFEASVSEVWSALFDPVILAAVMPGCEKLELIDGHYVGEIKVKVGPIQGKFTGKVDLKDINEPDSYTMVVDGRGAPGFVKATAGVKLTAEGTGTRVFYDADAQVGGKIASVGQRLLEASSRAIVAQSLEGLHTNIKLRAAAHREAAAAEAPTPSPATAAPPATDPSLAGPAASGASASGPAASTPAATGLAASGSAASDLAGSGSAASGPAGSGSAATTSAESGPAGSGSAGSGSAATTPAGSGPAGSGSAASSPAASGSAATTPAGTTPAASTPATNRAASTPAASTPAAPKPVPAVTFTPVKTSQAALANAVAKEVASSLFPRSVLVAIIAVQAIVIVWLLVSR